AHEGAPTVYEVYVCRSVLADTYLSAGRSEAAERIYRDLIELGEERQYRVPLALAYFGLAYLHLARGDVSEGVRLATRSLEILSPTHAWQLYADQGDRARLVVGAIRDTREGDAVLARGGGALGRAVEVPTVGVGASAAPALADDVVVSALGELQVTVAGQPLQPGAWVSAKARDLLAYLVTLR